MRRVTQIFQRYREAARHLRNVYYIPQSSSDWDVLEDFDEASVLLFKHMVLGELRVSRDGSDWLADPLAEFAVEPSADLLPIMINRKGQSGHWDNPVKKVKKGELTMHFIDYFDWDEMGQIDFRYFRVRIVKSQSYPDLVGSDALVETIYADVYYTEAV